MNETDTHVELVDASQEIGQVALVPPQKRNRHTIWLYVVVIATLVMAVGFTVYYFYTEHIRASQIVIDDSDLEGLTDDQAKERIRKHAEELRAHPPGDQATSEELATYYNQLLLGLSDNSTIITTYETTLSQKLDLTQRSLLKVAEAYAKRGSEGDSVLAVSIFNKARDYIRTHKLDIEADGLTTGELEEVDALQAELGL